MSPLSGDFAKMQLMDRALERRSPGSPAPVRPHFTSDFTTDFFFLHRR